MELLLTEKSAFSVKVSSPQELPGRAPASLYLAFHITARARILLIHLFLPFVMYGKKGRMNGRSLIGAAGDAPPGPLWRDPFGKKAGEAAHRGFPWLSLALAHGPPEQVCYLCAASVSVTLLCLFWTEPGKWVLMLCWAVQLGLSQMHRGLGQESHKTLIWGWMLDLCAAEFWQPWKS